MSFDIDWITDASAVPPPWLKKRKKKKRKESEIYDLLCD